MSFKLAQIVPATRTSLGRTEKFTYLIPKDLVGIQVGSVVKVSFGNRAIEGVIFSIDETETVSERTKAIEKIIWPIPIFTAELRKIAELVAEKYVSSLGMVVKLILTKYAPRISDRKITRASQTLSPEIKLTEAQNNAVEKIRLNLDKTQTVLLHGVTGSGKTEVYLKVAKEVVKKGRQVLVLVPEIALTPQTVNRFLARFPAESVAVVHSKISYGQKSAIWQQIFSGDIKILIGPRSALFAPFKLLGLIVMDEEHDPSYKQFDQSPRYHAGAVAEELSQLWKIPLVLSDATPSVESYYKATTGEFGLVSLGSRPVQEMPTVEMVDMRKEIHAGNFSIFSGKLLSKIKESTERNEQVILFLNRRGTATSLICRDCGTVVTCTRCEVPLVYHNAAANLQCHHCARRYPVPGKCAKCGSHNLKFLGTGTEKVEAEITAKFPDARIKRLDSDTVRNSKELEALYKDFVSGNFDILVGTQLVAKGWDLSRVGLIGVINADSMLALPDFRSNERTFQLITQVAGRSGRGKFRGQVVIQTFTPENFAIQAAAQQKYEQFFNKELADRKEFNYPPFSKIVKITFFNSKQDKAEQMAAKASEELKEATRQIQQVEIIGPASAFIPKEKNLYYYHVIIKLPQEAVMAASFYKNFNEVLRRLPPYVTIDVDPDTLL